MIEFSLDRQRSILHIKPQSALAQSDFEDLARVVDPYLAESGGLGGIVIEAKAFPGWDSLAAMAAHFRFLKDHHRSIRRVAIVTDFALAKSVEHVGSLFVAAEVKQFPAGQAEAARSWIADPASRH